MKVVFLRSNPIDPDPRVEKEIRSLACLGIKCSCVGWDRLSNYDSTIKLRLIGAESIPVHLIGIVSPFGSGVKNAPRILKFERSLYDWLINHSDDYDVVHACDLDTGVIARAACKKLGKPYVYDIFDFYCDSHIMPSWLKTSIRSMEFKVINSSRATIICTEQRKCQLDGATPREVIVVENTPEEVAISDSPGHTDESIWLSYVGVLTGDRFIDRIIDTVDKYPDLQFDIGGFGPLVTEIEDRQSRNPRIRFHGRVSYDVALRLEKDSDVMFGLYDPAIANNRLAAPNKYYESLMLGVPLIAVKETSVGEWVEEEQTGIALKPDFECEDLYLAITELVNKNSSGDISRRQNDLYRKKHHWSIMEARLQKLYLDISEELQRGANQ